MRITILQGAFLPVPPLRGGAIEKAWNALGQSFAELGHEVTHISRKCDGLPSNEKIGKVHHIRVGGFESTNQSIVLKIKELFYVLRVKKVLPPADILVTHAFWAPLLLNKSKYGKIYVHVGRYPKGQMKFYANASRLQVPTRAIAEAVKNEIPRKKEIISTLPYPLDWKATHCSTYPSKLSKILYLGRIHPEKGILELATAFKGIPARIRNDFKLTIRGPWRAEQGGGGPIYFSKIKEVAKSCEGMIEILDPTFSSEELKVELKNSQLFVYPSLAEKGETFGLSVLEAMSLGCVPIVSSLSCFRDLVVDQQNGYVFNHRTEDRVNLLSSTIQKAILSPEKNIIYSKKCLSLSKGYELDKLSLKYIEDFKAVLMEKDL